MNVFFFFWFRHDGTWLLCAIPTYTIPPKIHRPRPKKRKKEVNNSVSNHILSSSSFTHKHTSLAFISFIHTPEALIARLMPLSPHANKFIHRRFLEMGIVKKKKHAGPTKQSVLIGQPCASPFLHKSFEDEEFNAVAFLAL